MVSASNLRGTSWERGHPALVEGRMPPFPACSQRISAAAPAAKTPGWFSPQASGLLRISPHVERSSRS